MAVDDAYTKALLHFNGVDATTTFTDESGKVWTAVGDAQLDTDQKVFGTASGLFDGTLDRITTPAHEDFNYGTGDFTVDFRVRFNGSVPATAYLCGHSIDSGNYIFFRLYSGDLNFVNEINPGGQTINIARAPSFIADTWYHVAFTRNGNDIRLFKDGVQLGATGTATGSAVTATGVFTVGSGEYNGAFLTPLNGLIDEFRVSKGIARWTANFTPPAFEYAPAVTHTVIDVVSAPLSIAISGYAESLFLDFAATPLTFYSYMEFGAVTADFSEYPLDLAVSASLSEMFYLDMGTAPLLITTSFDPAFEGRGENFLRVELPSLTMTSELVVRSFLLEADLPVPTMIANLLVGEVLSIEADLPNLDMVSALTIHVFGSITAELPALDMVSNLITGQLIYIDAALPALTMISNLYQVPKLLIQATIPSLFMSSNLRVLAITRNYRATALNLKTMAVTKYEDFGFNSFCFFNGVYLAANENGIYVLGGDTDAGAEIDWYFKTPQIDLLNAVPLDVWFSLRNKNSLTLKVNQNENIETPYTYPVNADTDPQIHMERVKLGRGLDARVMQMTVSGTGVVDLNGISIVTNPAKKSKR